MPLATWIHFPSCYSDTNSLYCKNNLSNIFTRTTPQCSNASLFSELVSDRAFSLVYWIYCQHRQQQSLWFTLRTTTAGQGTWFRSPEGAVQKHGAYDFQKAKTKLHGSEWKTWTCNHFARVLPIMMQKVKLSARGVTMPENMSPWPIVGYSLPRVYPATHQCKKNVAIFK